MIRRIVAHLHQRRDQSKFRDCHPAFQWSMLFAKIKLYFLRRRPNKMKRNVARQHALLQWINLYYRTYENI